MPARALGNSLDTPAVSSELVITNKTVPERYELLPFVAGGTRKGDNGISRGPDAFIERSYEVKEDVLGVTSIVWETCFSAPGRLNVLDQGKLSAPIVFSISKTVEINLVYGAISELRINPGSGSPYSTSASLVLQLQNVTTGEMLVNILKEEHEAPRKSVQK